MHNIIIDECICNKFVIIIIIVFNSYKLLLLFITIYDGGTQCATGWIPTRGYVLPLPSSPPKPQEPTGK